MGEARVRQPHIPCRSVLRAQQKERSDSKVENKDMVLYVFHYTINVTSEDPR